MIIDVLQRFRLRCLWNARDALKQNRKDHTPKPVTSTVTGSFPFSGGGCLAADSRVRGIDPDRYDYPGIDNFVSDSRLLLKESGRNQPHVQHSQCKRCHSKLSTFVMTSDDIISCIRVREREWSEHETIHAARMSWKLTCKLGQD